MASLLGFVCWTLNSVIEVFVTASQVIGAIFNLNYYVVSSVLYAAQVLLLGLTRLPAHIYDAGVKVVAYIESLALQFGDAIDDKAKLSADIWIAAFKFTETVARNIMLYVGYAIRGIKSIGCLFGSAVEEELDLLAETVDPDSVNPIHGTPRQFWNPFLLIYDFSVLCVLAIVHGITFLFCLPFQFIYSCFSFLFSVMAFTVMTSVDIILFPFRAAFSVFFSYTGLVVLGIVVGALLVVFIAYVIISEFIIGTDDDESGIQRGVLIGAARPSNSSAVLCSSPEELQHQMLCVVCQERDKNVLLMPCKHLCLCNHCADVIMRGHNVTRQCPMCRARIRNSMLVYV